MTLQARTSLWMCAVTLIAACSTDSPERAQSGAGTQASTATESSAKRVADSAQPMSGVDHTNMPGMQPPAAKPGTSGGQSAPMAGMDHSQMNMGTSTAAAEPRRAASPPMAGMDHSQMNMGTSTSGSARQPSTSPGRAGTQPMSGMDHSTMMQTQSVSTPVRIADEKLQQLVGILVKDPEVLRRIQADSVLRNRWSDPGVRTQITAAANNSRK